MSGEPGGGAPPERWLHDLRNAINGACVTAMVVRSLIEGDRAQEALKFLDDLDASCERCRQLIERPPAR